MTKLTKQELMNIYSVGKNLTDKPIFIDFYADWWGPCRLFNSVLDDITPRYEGKINMYKVNIEEEPEIANLFGVMSIPATSMIRKDGKTESSVGSMTSDQLKYWLDGLVSNN